MKSILCFIIKIYQLCISPLMIGQCRFTPTCSHYAISAIKQLPLSQALKLIIKRLSRCHPYSNHSGYDPILTNLEKEKNYE